MLKFFLKHRSKFFLAALLLLGAWLLILRGSDRASELSFLKRGVQALWLPVQRTVAAVLAFPEDTLNAVRELRNLRKEVDRLQIENQSLRLELADHRSLRKELERLEGILKIRSDFPRQARLARIVAHDPSAWKKTFVIDSGSRDGVETGSPVVSEHGIVGRVLDVAADHARVLMITDVDSSVAGVDDRSRVIGIAQGTGSNRMKYAYVPTGEDVQLNDVILSSGLGGVFPKGYRIGTVVEREEEAQGLLRDIVLAPAVDFAALDYVFVLPPLHVHY